MAPQITNMISWPLLQPRLDLRVELAGDSMLLM
jgi:hypothetical protein